MTDLQKQFENSSSKYCEFISINDFNSIIHISLKYNYIYIETPKVACSTIKRTLQKIELNDLEFNNLHDRNFSPLIRPSQVKNLDRFIDNLKPFKFCFVRNPYTRLLSAYLDKIKKSTPIKNEFTNYIEKNYSRIVNEIDFDLFVNIVCEQSTKQMNRHWRIQYYQTLSNNISYDFIGKFEKFDDDFLFLLEKIKPGTKQFIASWQNHATNANQVISQYYNPTLIETVKEKFAIDFEFFNYDPDAIK